jgi:DedD protein
MLKQRLVGALILVALGVVFWPIIFMEPGSNDGGDRGRIPDRPMINTAPVEPPDMAGLRPSPDIFATEQIEKQGTDTDPVPEEAPKATAEPVVKPVTEVTRTRKEAPVKPAVDSDGVPVAWILQVASVSTADKADELRQRLLKMKHKAYVKRIKSGGKTLYRIYIGPGFERAKFESMKTDIDREFAVESLVVRYLP